MKTIEEKRKELEKYCEANPQGCDGCPLTICSSIFESFSEMTESEINACWDQLFELTAKAPVELENAPSIKDSGARTEFPTGAVRDIQEGKGRCDLLPLDVVAEYLTLDGSPNLILSDVCLFQIYGEWGHLVRALDAFNEYHWRNNKTMILEVAKHFEEGAKKYGEHNWQKGIPLPRYIDSAVRHYLKWLRGDKDEPHDRAFCWNIMCAIWTCKHKPELNTYRRKDDESC